MRLSAFIKENIDTIIDEFEDFVRDIIVDEQDLTDQEIRDHMKSVVLDIANDMQESETPKEKEAKSKGLDESEKIESDAQTHGATRVEQGMSITDINAEYRLLRAKILKLWMQGNDSISTQDFEDMLNFNEAIDAALSKSVIEYEKIIEDARNTFLGILGHDIRNPLGAIMGMTELLNRSNELSDKHQDLVISINQGARHALSITDNLLELTRIQMGSNLNVSLEKCDISAVCQSAVEQTQHAYPKSDIQFKTHGDLNGNFDYMRIQQIIENLLRNAIQHGDQSRSITLTANEKENAVEIILHNFGHVITPEKIENIFKKYSLPEKGEQTRNLGLGLYIVNEIVSAHNGHIEVTSDETDGTSFTVTLPNKT